MPDQWKEKLRCPRCENIGSQPIPIDPTLRSQPLMAFRMASKLSKLSMVRTSIAGPVTSRCRELQSKTPSSQVAASLICLKPKIPPAASIPYRLIAGPFWIPIQQATATPAASHQMQSQT